MKLLPKVFAALFGAFLGMTLLKFGNPPIMEKFVVAPANALEFFLNCPWPIAWAYYLLGGLILVGAAVARWRPATPLWLLALPLAWLAWELIASTQTVDPQLTRPTLVHFAACCACFYLAVFCLGPHGKLNAFWPGLLIGFGLVLAAGFEQHFGGLEETRRYFRLYVYPQMQEVPLELWKKMSTDRIFSTLFYPNALAGVILLLFPLTMALLAQTRRFTPAARGFLLLVAGSAAIACLFWSGSKGGWLLFLLLGFIALLHLRFDKQLKLLLVGCLLVAGLTAFGWKYAGFFRKGATSVVARFDYWQAAIRTASIHPLVGTGPGTFARPYAEIKKPEAEMSRLVHNDYLEQASDSGLPGFAIYTAFMVLALARTYPGRFVVRQPGEQASVDWLPFSIWLGVLGWALQGLLEFGLYIPALAWLAFAFLGLLLSAFSRPAARKAIAVDKLPQANYPARAA